MDSNLMQNANLLWFQFAGTLSLLVISPIPRPFRCSIGQFPEVYPVSQFHSRKIILEISGLVRLRAIFRGTLPPIFRHSRLDDGYIAKMEDVLETFERPYDTQQPVVCLDERPVTLHADVRPASPARPGREARRDNEYERCGTANIF
jgi:hypothetical protein